MRLRFAFFISTVLFCFSLDTIACECMGFANAQQAAQRKNVIIAKVETIASENGKARVRVEKVLKGGIHNVYLDIQGQDGVNCNGDNLAINQKGLLLFEKTEDGYQTLVCAQTNIPLTENDLYQIYLGEEFLLSENQIKDVLAYRAQASVKSAECLISINRTPVPFDSNTELSFQYNTSVSAVPTRDELTILKTNIDLSPLAPNVRELFFYAEVKKIDVSKYSFYMRMKDPFTGLLIDRVSYTMDMRKELQFAGPTLSRFTDLSGNPLNESQLPFLSHQTQTFCALNLGHPLELVK